MSSVKDNVFLSSQLMNKKRASEATKGEDVTESIFTYSVFISAAFLNCRFPVIASSASPARLDVLRMLTSEGQRLRHDEGHVQREGY